MAKKPNAPTERQSSLAANNQDVQPQSKTPASGNRGTGFSVQSVKMEYEGPIPAAQFEAYEQTESGRQFVQLLFDQARHRMELEKAVVNGDNRRADLGLAAGVLIAMAFLSAGVYLVINGHDTAGATIAVTSLGSLVYTFVYGTNSRKEERRERLEILTQRQPDQKPKPPQEEAPRLPGM